MLKIALSFLCVAAVSALCANEITGEDIRRAREQQNTIIHAHIEVVGRRGEGTRSERFVYSIRRPQVLLKGERTVSLETTYEPTTRPKLAPGEYVLILQPGPLGKAEKLRVDSPRFVDIQRWIDETSRR